MPGAQVPTCQRLAKTCYDHSSRLVCVLAALYCNSQLYAQPIQREPNLKFQVRVSHPNALFFSSESGLNPYDARRTCDRTTDGLLCYREMGWVDTYMNQPDVEAALGANPQRTFEFCNMAINQAFLLQGDSMCNTPALFPPLINDGVNTEVVSLRWERW